ncbi:Hypothetical predicted protein, partial [Paramuricea clavata]
MYKELSDTDLTECLQHDQRYHCQFQNVLSKNVKTSCLFILFTRNLELIEDTCDMRVDHITRTATQLSPHRFRLTAPEPEILEISCTNPTSYQQISFKGIQYFSLNLSCSASTPNYFFTVNTQLHEKDNLIAVPFEYTKDQFLGPAILKHSLKRIKNELTLMKVSVFNVLYFLRLMADKYLCCGFTQWRENKKLERKQWRKHKAREEKTEASTSLKADIETEDSD